ncbi:hypothetical protein QS5_0406 [Clostridioides difficile P15]|nr:hypothetical protein [Clostridioides difficile]EQJ26133.1 hypothetical protein QS5_0406 [Clostridioides difficile P15]
MKNKKFNVITLIILDNHIYAINKDRLVLIQKEFTLKKVDFSVIISE